MKTTCVLFAVMIISSAGSMDASASPEHSDRMYEQQQSSKTVTGRVTDPKGEPLIGVSVSATINGAITGTITDGEGKYSITLKGNPKLSFTYIGYKTVTLTPAGTTLDVKMEETSELIDEVVVTAMGIKKERKALGYSVQDINADELMKNKNSNLLNSLNGKIAGLNVTQSSGAAGAGASIIIRGGTSLERDNQPLFVVDGMIYDNGTDVGGNSGFDGANRVNSTNSNRVMDINPEDIANVSVLKGPAASALYGSRAAAGVIVITTKKGEEGVTKVNISSKLSTSWVNSYPEQQMKYKRGFYSQAGTFDDYTTQSWGKAIESGDQVYNNIEDFYDNGSTWDNNVSVSGGSKNSSFFLSTSRYDQTGIIPGTGYDKTTFRFNGEHKFNKLTVGAKTAYSVANTDKAITSAGLTGSGGTGAMLSVNRWAIDDDMKHWLNEDGSKYRMFEGKQQLADDVDNPYWIIDRNPITDKTTRFTGTINAKYDVTDWFNVAYTLGTDRYTTNTRRLIGAGGGVQLSYQRGMLSENDYTYEYLSSNFMMNFSKKITDFDFNLLVGHSVEDTKSVVNRRLAWNFVIDEFYNLNNTSNDDRRIAQSNSRNRLVGVYGEFRVGYKNWAYATVTGRNDWTSTLPVDNRSYFYPSVSGSILFSELLPKNDIIYFGKLRASWAEVGKDASPYVTNTYVDPPYPTIGGNGIQDSWSHGNNILIPEKTKSTEIGLEMSFLDGRLGFDLAYYNNKSINQLVSPRTSQATGYIFMMTNAGDITNKGIELSIKAEPVKTKNFSWNTMLNLGKNKGKVNNLLQGLEVLYVTDVQVGNAKAASFNGGNFMAIAGSKYSRDDNGNVILDWDTGMPTYDGKATYEIGNREPKLTGGLTNTLRYRDFEFSFLLDFRLGGDIYNGTDYYMTSIGRSLRSIDRESITLSGAAKNPTTGDLESKTYTFEANKFYLKGVEVPSGTAKAESGNYIIQNYYSDYYNRESANYMTDTNWLRLRSISLAYYMPSKLINKLKFVKAMSVNVTGTNLLLFTNYKGMDPETSAAGGAIGSGSTGIDYNGVPATAGMSFGLNVTF
ncbi:SusC/RagA family TonB-linked outer membrane protein [Massilibacteroides sp.]|uniref:SusC/RagA family TonB-linked outer membrane protein n=1 Tax=Massilibacteroides sp. TaxID=2034766 RepID=UPI0026325316|nr:SusC/RagA family TonB-linked outer membrane protein [Massilibacteroides sp.]MDD4514461.1 SusC/RagA family TonB-linked outer membrane protein [Massilibacteroides sp.]